MRGRFANAQCRAVERVHPGRLLRHGACRRGRQPTGLPGLAVAPMSVCRTPRLRGTRMAERRGVVRLGLGFEVGGRRLGAGEAVPRDDAACSLGGGSRHGDNDVVVDAMCVTLGGGDDGVARARAATPASRERWASRRRRSTSMVERHHASSSWVASSRVAWRRMSSGDIARSDRVNVLTRASRVAWVADTAKTFLSGVSLRRRFRVSNEAARLGDHGLCLRTPSGSAGRSRWPRPGGCGR